MCSLVIRLAMSGYLRAAWSRKIWVVLEGREIMRGMKVVAARGGAEVDAPLVDERWRLEGGAAIVIEGMNIGDEEGLRVFR